MTTERLYKEALPKETIRKIQNILNEIDLLVLPNYWGNPYNEIYSVRVEAIDEDGGFSANGKGRNQLYALASAYAEIIERVQNQLISGIGGFNKVLLKQIKNTIGFYYYPDEKPLIKKDFFKLPSEIHEDIFPVKSLGAQKKLIDYIFNRKQIAT